MIGRILGHYKVIEQIGAGGMGVVYRARDERLERDVALKVLAAGSLGDDDARGRFRKEALALAKVNHTHIGAIYDFDTHDGLDFLVMEFIDGTTLADMLAGTKLLERDILTLGGQIARALEDAHEHGIVHRDLKPGNIMVNRKGAAKVLDFGLARRLEPAKAADAPTRTQTRALAGTPPYMTPEQLRGGTADSRTDIHALGAVLYEMATGQRAFPDDQPSQLVDAILNRAPVTPRAFNPAMSSELERIVLKCLEKDPGQRYQSAGEVAIDLDRLKSQRPTAAPRSAAPSRRAWLFATGAAAVAAVALWVLSDWRNGGRQATAVRESSRWRSCRCRTCPPTGTATTSPTA
jgi:serine/threonine protein kinase